MCEGANEEGMLHTSVFHSNETHWDIPLMFRDNTLKSYGVAATKDKQVVI
jgi:hypothetical protein